jgi:adiponectin receptor
MIPVIHYSFYCYLKLKAIYIGVLFVLSVASIIGTSSAACSKPQCRPFKAILFIALGLYGIKTIYRIFYETFFPYYLGVAPATHACILHGMARMFQMGFLYLCLMAVTYIAGGVTYAVRVPERFFPGKYPLIKSRWFNLFLPGRFDIVGQSHHVLHIAVIVAVYLHFYCLCRLFHTVIRTEQCLNPVTLKLGITDLSIS